MKKKGKSKRDRGQGGRNLSLYKRKCESSEPDL